MRDAGVTVAFDVFHEPAEALLPLVGEGVPFPAGQVMEPVFAVGIKGAVGMEVALRDHPLTEPIAIDRVGHWDAGVTVAFDVVLESAETLLPLVSAGIPCPAGQPLESAFAVSLKGAFAVELALRTDPHTPSG